MQRGLCDPLEGLFGDTRNPMMIEASRVGKKSNKLPLRFENSSLKLDHPPGRLAGKG